MDCRNDNNQSSRDPDPTYQLQIRPTPLDMPMLDYDDEKDFSNLIIVPETTQLLANPTPGDMQGPSSTCNEDSSRILNEPGTSQSPITEDVMLKFEYDSDLDDQKQIVKTMEEASFMFNSALPDMLSRDSKDDEAEPSNISMDPAPGPSRPPLAHRFSRKKDEASEIQKPLKKRSRGNFELRKNGEGASLKLVTEVDADNITEGSPPQIEDSESESDTAAESEMVGPGPGSSRPKQKQDPEEFVEECMESQRFFAKELVEALDKQNCGKIRHAVVCALYGERVLVKYLGEDPEEEGFWFSQRSDLIHKVGWARAVGVQLHHDKHPNWRWPRPPSSEFPHFPAEQKLEATMMFEMRHPLYPNKIVAGYVKEVYKEGYFLSQTDWTRVDEITEIVLHVTSDYIVPINFCRDNGIPWDPPLPWKDTSLCGKKFDWKKFIEAECARTCVPLDFSEINKFKRENEFKVGDKVEAARVVDPKRVSRATVVQVAGYLIKVEFDEKDVPAEGEDEDLAMDEQWMSCTSSNLYPKGYRRLVKLGYRGEL